MKEVPTGLPNDIEAGLIEAIKTKIYDLGCALPVEVTIPETLKLTKDQRDRFNAQLGSFKMHSSSALKLMHWQGWRIIDGWDATAVGAANALGKGYGDQLLHAYFSSLLAALKNVNSLHNSLDLKGVRVGGDEAAVLSKKEATEDKSKKKEQKSS